MGVPQGVEAVQTAEGLRLKEKAKARAGTSQEWHCGCLGVMELRHEKVDEDGRAYVIGLVTAGNPFVVVVVVVA